MFSFSLFRQQDVNKLLVSAIHEQQFTHVEHWLKQGADVNRIKSADLGLVPPLHLAAWYGQDKVVELLLSRGAKVYLCAVNPENPLNKHDFDDGETPLHTAANQGHTNVISILLEHGANANACTEKNETPLHVAAEQGHTDAIKMLLKYDANINATNIDGKTPLDLAAEIGHYNAVECLLKRGAISSNEESLIGFLEGKKDSHIVDILRGDSIDFGEYDDNEFGGRKAIAEKAENTEVLLTGEDGKIPRSFSRFN